jgi:serine/threonine-protein kinase RsbW
MQIDLTIDADYEQLRIPAEALRNAAARAGVPEVTVGLCELALQELLTNLVDHAYGGNSSNQIGFHAQVGPAKIQMMTEDSGQAVNLDLEAVSMPDPFALQEGGYGMAIIKSLMDEVTCHRQNGKNIWVLVKHY